MENACAFKKIIAAVAVAASMMLTLTACGGATAGDDEEKDKTAPAERTQIRIATKNTPEQNILSHLAERIIEEKTELNAEVVYYDDSTSSSLAGKMAHNDIQVFFDYTGSLAVNALGMERENIYSPTLLQDTQNGLKKQYQIELIGEIGYSSTTAFYITIPRRVELGSPTTLSEIAKMSPKLKCGMDQGFYSRVDCFEAICDLYNMDFKATKVLAEDEGFDALMDGDIDLYIGESVSPYLSLFDVKQLVDDQYFFLPQTTCCLVSEAALKKYPEVEAALKNLEGLISASRMSLMIQRVYWEGNDIDDYVYTFLRANNLI